MLFKNKGYPILKHKQKVISPRHASFSAILEYEKKGKQIQKSLRKWKETTNPKDEDYQLAQEISNGVVKRKLTLEYFIKQIENLNKLKIREKIILYIALYQMQFMNKIPFYAIVDESVALAKKVISLQTAAFFNSILRKLDQKRFKKAPSKSLDILYSYPKYFIDLLVHQFGVKQSEDLLEIMNLPPKIFVKKRKQNCEIKIKKEDADVVYEKNFVIYRLKNLNLIEALKDHPNYYFQSLTQAKLVDNLALRTKNVSSAIDLCASPGGKIIAVADLYDEALLFANDVSSARIQTLKKNIVKYNLDVKLLCEPAEKLDLDQHFDLVIVDAPCTNSGVLNRRAEARWKITKDHLHGLVRLQKEILKNAVNLINDNGSIWYLTCSILSDENEKIIKEACEKFSLKLEGKMHKIIPDKNGLDGGFGCVLKKL